MVLTNHFQEHFTFNDSKNKLTLYFEYMREHISIFLQKGF